MNFNFNKNMYKDAYGMYSPLKPVSDSVPSISHSIQNPRSSACVLMEYGPDFKFFNPTFLPICVAGKRASQPSPNYSCVFR